MIKTILWDFDGVILDTMKIKGDGFLELFKNYDKSYLEKFEEFHYENGGVSRFEKIKYFFNNILQENILEKEVLILANKFSKIIEKRIFDYSNLIADSVEYIKANYKQYDFHIVSGAEHTELNNLCKYFKLEEYFISINGSPVKKEILIKNIIKKYNYIKNEIILIGDSINDYKAANINNIKFYGYNNDFRAYYYIETFKKVSFE